MTLPEQVPEQTVLVVDDVPVNIKLLQATLTGEFRIQTALNGPDALKIALSEDAPDLILLDIMMPEMDGYEVCRRLKAENRTRDIPVIFLTAKGEQEDEEQGFLLGGVDFIRKPIRPAVVRARIKSQLDLKFHRDHLEKEIAEQEISIDLAKKILCLINGHSPRHIDLPDNKRLFIDTFSMPCHKEGGDHYFIRNMSNGRQGQYGKTLISLKDQSGHEVGCMLRSITTDMMHNALLNEFGSLPLEEVIAKLNDNICQSHVFEHDDFLTSINAEIDHATLLMRYVSTGHPPFFMIRDGEVYGLPEFGESGTNLPLAVHGGIRFSAGECELRDRDKLIFYSDGLNEIHNGGIRSLTVRDLREVLMNIIDKDPAIPVAEVTEALVGEMSRLQAGAPGMDRAQFGDDVTIIGMEVEDMKDYEEVILEPRNPNDIHEAIEQLHRAICRQWIPMKFGGPAENIRMVLEEALSNAWKHGNMQDPGKKITVRWRSRNDCHLEVIDEGDGFDFESVPDPTTEDNVTCPSGRGILIMQHVASSVQWKRGGRHIVLDFRKHEAALGVEQTMRHPDFLSLWKNMN
ncbi:MAG: response regulator [Deltaproteobacteria bacterium]|nr:response regulator [Deltaproteobacteria bacterium]